MFLTAPGVQVFRQLRAEKYASHWRHLPSRPNTTLFYSLAHLVRNMSNANDHLYIYIYIIVVPLKMHVSKNIS